MFEIRRAIAQRRIDESGIGTQSQRLRPKPLFTSLICGAPIILTRATAGAEEHEFRYKAPDGKSVELICEPNGWSSADDEG